MDSFATVWRDFQDHDVRYSKNVNAITYCELMSYAILGGNVKHE